MHELTIREATEADAAALPALHNAAIRELAGETYREAVVEAWTADRSASDYPVGRTDRRFVVASRDDRVLGFGEVVPESPAYVDAEGEVRAVYVRPDAARAGVGSALYADLERWARERVASLGLLASVNAVPFYERQGFAVVAETTHEFGGEVEAPATAMRKKLV